MKQNPVTTYSLTMLNIVLGLCIIAPLLYTFSVSFMAPDQVFKMQINLLPSSFYTGNYKSVVHSVPIFRFIANSFLVSLAVTVGQVITSCCAAYAFTYYAFRGKNFLFILILATVMIPGEAIIISNYLTIGALNMLDTYRGLILPHLSSAMGVFMMRQFFLAVPKELKEASVIDGMSSFAFLTRILIPVSKPAIASLGMYVFLNTWNQYMWPLLVTSRQEMRTVQIGISMLRANEAESFGLIMAGISIIIIPSILIFVIGQQYLRDGMMTGAVKG